MFRCFLMYVVESAKCESEIIEAKKNLLRKFYAYAKIYAGHCQESVNNFKPWTLF